MNKQLTKDLTTNELLVALKALPIGKAPGENGLPAELFLALWETVGHDIFEACKETLHSGTLHQELNTGLLCLIPKGEDKMNIRNWRLITLLGIVYKI